MEIDTFVHAWASYERIADVAHALDVSESYAIAFATDLSKRGIELKRLIPTPVKRIRHNHFILKELATKNKYLDNIAAEYDRCTALSVWQTLYSTLKIKISKSTNPNTVSCPVCLSSHRQWHSKRCRDRSRDSYVCFLCGFHYSCSYTPYYSVEAVYAARRASKYVSEQASALGWTSAELRQVAGAMKKDGTWRRKRYTDEDFVTTFNQGSYKAVVQAFGLTPSSAETIAVRLRARGHKLLSSTPKARYEPTRTDILRTLRNAIGCPHVALSASYGLSSQEADNYIKTYETVLRPSPAHS